MAEENLGVRVNNIELLIQYMAQTQRDLSTNQELLTNILQRQDERMQQQAEEIQLLRQILQQHEERLQRYDETILVMQGQIRILLERLLGNN
ncbi:MAG: hypothetical protein ACK421_09440 [Pseudanabaenaceae cyanobacterium]